MHNFDYFAPTELSEAVALLSEYGERAKPLAGGTDLIDQMRLRNHERKRSTLTDKTIQNETIRPMTRKRIVELSLNGSPQEVFCEPRQTLLEILRDRLQYTRTKEGCNNGNCGACTVLFNGKPVVSCLVFGVEADGAEIETIERRRRNGRSCLHWQSQWHPAK